MRVTLTPHPTTPGPDIDITVEATGDVNATLTLSTNAMVLEALFYKHNAGPLFKNGLADDNSYFAHRATDEFNPPRRCLPGERVMRSAP